MERILLVEDDATIVAALTQFLLSEGFSVQSASGQTEAFSAIEATEFDLVLLDVGLKDGNGFSICSAIKQRTKSAVIFLSASGDEYSVVTGLDLGADDYIVKPFSPGVVMAHIRAVLRRLPAQDGSETLVIGSLSIHLPSLSVTLDGHRLSLTRKEVELLYTLASAPGRVFTRDNLLTIVWGYEHAGNYRAVDSHIKRLRQKLDAYPHDFFTIATVWGTGYKFERRLP